jgi:hypothetical protein
MLLLAELDQWAAIAELHRRGVVLHSCDRWVRHPRPTKLLRMVDNDREIDRLAGQWDRPAPWRDQAIPCLRRLARVTMKLGTIPLVPCSPRRARIESPGPAHSPRRGAVGCTASASPAERCRNRAG